MVIPVAWSWVLAAAIGGGPPADAPPSTAPVASALGKGSYPWYDAPEDEIKTFGVPALPTVRVWGLGDLVAVVAFVVALIVLAALLVWLYRLYEPTARAEVASTPPRSRGAVVEQLPAGLRRGFDSDDPWAEAIRRRDRGDLAGAIVCLFAHQLLTLSRLGLVRLGPGKTGRQLVRAVADAEFRGLVQPTLRHFEAAYYGHQSPTPAEFAAVWAAAEAFERRVARGVAA